MCMSTANYDPERMQPMLLDTVHTCALILQIFKENIYIYLRFVCNYLQHRECCLAELEFTCALLLEIFKSAQDYFVDA